MHCRQSHKGPFRGSEIGLYIGAYTINGYDLCFKDFNTALTNSSFFYFRCRFMCFLFVSDTLSSEMSSFSLYHIRCKAFLRSEGNHTAKSNKLIYQKT